MKLRTYAVYPLPTPRIREHYKWLKLFRIISVIASSFSIREHYKWLKPGKRGRKASAQSSIREHYKWGALKLIVLILYGKFYT